MPYPKSLTNYINRVQNVSKNTVKLTPYRTDSVKSGSIIVLDLPTNAMVDMDSLCWHFNGTTTTSSGYASFPRHIESIISKISIELNGMSIASCNHLSDLYNIMYSYTQGTDMESKRKLFNNAAEQTAPSANVTSKVFKVQHFLGFLSSAQGRVLDLGVIGNARIHIYLENTAVLISNTAVAPQFELNNMYFTVDCISIDDSVYYNAKSSFISGGGIIEVPFDSYYSSLFSAATYNQSSKFSVSTGSLDYVLACFPQNRTIQALDANTHNSGYFTYAADMAASNTTNTLVDWSFSVNNVQIPQYKSAKSDAYPLMLNVLGTSQTTDGGICSSVSDADVWSSSYWVAGVRLDLNTDVDERTISGLNTLGNNTQIEFATSGIGSFSPSNVLMFAKSTSVLKIGSGRTLELLL